MNFIEVTSINNNSKCLINMTHIAMIANNTIYFADAEDGYIRCNEDYETIKNKIIASSHSNMTYIVD